MGCGCLALVIAVALGIVFFIYASTDPGPPIEGIVVLAGTATIVLYRALGVPTGLRTDPE